LDQRINIRLNVLNRNIVNGINNNLNQRLGTLENYIANRFRDTNNNINNINQNFNNRFDKINTDINNLNERIGKLDSRTNFGNTVIDNRLKNIEESNEDISRNILNIDKRIIETDGSIRRIRNDNFFERLTNMQDQLNTHMTTQDTILGNMQNIIRQDDSNFEIMFENFQNNMQNFINDRIEIQERDIMRGLFERLNQRRNPKRITINHRRTLRIGRSPR
ncbi:5244_t:CDS:1, partial [Scutellospora calospora]